MSTTCPLAPAGTQVKHTDSHMLTPKVVSASPMAESPGMGDAPSYRSQVALSPVLSQQQGQDQGAAFPLLFTETWTVSVPEALCKSLLPLAKQTRELSCIYY